MKQKCLITGKEDCKYMGEASLCDKCIIINITENENKNVNKY